MLSLFTLPDASTIITSSTAYSGSFFTEFLPIVYLAVGVLIFALGVGWLIKTLKGGMRMAFGKGGRKGRGRRR